MFTGTLQQHFNASIDDGIFPTKVKKGEITCVFKANDQTIKTNNYRPITVLSAVATVYEHLMSEQIVAYSEAFLSRYLCGFHENTQQTLVRFVEKCKSVLEKGIHRSNPGGPLQGVLLPKS